MPARCSSGCRRLQFRRAMPRAPVQGAPVQVATCILRQMIAAATVLQQCHALLDTCWTVDWTQRTHRSQSRALMHPLLPSALSPEPAWRQPHQSGRRRCRCPAPPQIVQSAACRGVRACATCTCTGTRQCQVPAWGLGGVTALAGCNGQSSCWPCAHPHCDGLVQSTPHVGSTCC